MKKKLVVAVLCACMMVGCVACGKEKETEPNIVESVSEGDEPTESDEEWNWEDTAAEAEVEEKENDNPIIRVEEMYDEDDEERAVLEGLQGKIKFLDRTLTTAVFFAENKLYTQGYGNITPIIEVNEAPEMIQFFDNMEIGETVLSYANGKMTCYDEYGVHNESIAFNPQTDYVVDVGMGESWYIFSKQESGYVIRYYGDMDGSGTISGEENVLTEIYNKEGENIIEQVKDIIVLPSSRYGCELFCITNDNLLYEVVGVYSDSLEVKLASDAIANVETVHAPATVAINLAEPVYSKVGEESTVYSMAPGDDLFETTDNYEVAFPMPDGHVVSEIVDIFSCDYAVVFAFDNGDVYITPEIEESGTDTYEMTKLEEISQLNKEGKVAKMAGGTISFDECIYLLMDTNELYCYIVE